jgi:hypothetical protein
MIEQQAPVLLLGGYGSLGARTARVLRALHPSVPITIAGRNATRADALAREIGNAATTTIDLDRPDLGLPGSDRYAVVVVALRDLALNSMRYAQEQGIPYIALSDGVFELGPTVTRYIHQPAAAPIVLQGHGIGAVPVLAAINFARQFRAIDSIETGLLFDPEDPLGDTSVADMERINHVGPLPLTLLHGRWRWIQGDAIRRTFTGVDGRAHAGAAVGLVDVLSLSSTGARSIRIDLAEGVTASRLRGGAASHEVVIEIVGEHRDGTVGRHRYELVDPQGYAALSARGIAATIERLLGLADAPPPGPGLYFPEMLVDPSRLLGQLETQGVGIRAA